MHNIFLLQKDKKRMYSRIGMGIVFSEKTIGDITDTDIFKVCLRLHGCDPEIVDKIRKGKHY